MPTTAPVRPHAGDAGDESGTLDGARAWSSSIGVTRATSVTAVDRIGVPVAAAVRPGAARGSLVVTGGKARTEPSAEIGARMEAVELAFAEPARAAVRPARVEFGELHSDPDFGLADLCPRVGERIALRGHAGAVVANALLGGRAALVPSELVLLPAPRLGALAFGASSNGLGAGWTLEQATRHAVLEVIEKDTLSFPIGTFAEFSVDSTAIPSGLSVITDAVRAAGVELDLAVIRSAPGLPVGVARLRDRDGHGRRFIHGGHACDRDVAAALERAVLEALQSRASFMHGSREDLAQLAIGGNAEQPWTPAGAPADLATITDTMRPADTSAEIAQLLADAGLGPALRVVLRDGSDNGPWVVRMIVPRCEFFVPTLSPRVGPRLAAASRA